MNIMGLQKLSLLDFPGKMACTLFTGGCNFRCPFCHNASLVEGASFEPQMHEDEFFAFLDKRHGILDGVCVTGGEPTLQPDLALFLKKIKERGFSVKLDTNGALPEKLRALVEAGLVDYVAMDIKNTPQKYPQTVGLADFDVAPVLQSVDYLLSSAVDFEFRTTVVRELHTAEDLLEIGRWVKGAPRYFLQAFADSGDLLREGLHGYDKNEMQDLLNLLKTELPNAEIRGQ